MLTRIKIRNFKRFVDVDIELGEAVVLIGPNNSGKTTVLQALALWDIGVRRWNEKRKGRPSPEKRPGVTINRRDLVSIPVPHADLLWRDLHVRDVTRVEKDGKPSTKTQNVRVEVVVEGVTNGKLWSCGLEFDYANEESFYCRPVRTGDGQERMPVPDEAENVNVAFLPPMSGLADREFLKQQGEIGVLIGQGQTAQVLRNLCYQIYQGRNGRWDLLVQHIHDLFGVDLLEPLFTPERSEITMAYKEGDSTLDLSSSGRGLQQTLLLLAHLYANPGSALLLDEPDAHLEFLRQRQTYNLLTQVGKERGSQIIAASHSEVVLNEAAGRAALCMELWAHRTIDNHAASPMGLHIIEGIYGRDGDFNNGPNPFGNENNYDGRAWDYMTNIVIFGKSPYLVDIVGHWLGGHEPGNFGLFHIAMERGKLDVMNPMNIPVYEWQDGVAVRRPLTSFTRTPLRSFYLQQRDERAAVASLSTSRSTTPR